MRRVAAEGKRKTRTEEEELASKSGSIELQIYTSNHTKIDLKVSFQYLIMTI